MGQEGEHLVGVGMGWGMGGRGDGVWVCVRACAGRKRLGMAMPIACQSRTLDPLLPHQAGISCTNPLPPVPVPRPPPPAASCDSIQAVTSGRHPAFCSVTLPPR